MGTNMARESEIDLMAMYGDIPMLSPEDISDAVFYVISTPPNVNVSVNFDIYLFHIVLYKWFFELIHVFFSFNESCKL